MRTTRDSNPIQGFTPTSIATATGGVAFDTTGACAIRISDDSEYFINADSANKAIMPAGSTVIDLSVTSITFTTTTIVEVMA